MPYAKMMKLLAKPMSLLRCTLVVVTMLFGIGNSAHATVGANTPFISYEAEAGTLAGGAVAVSLTAPRQRNTPARSWRRRVMLMFSLPTPANR